MKGSLTKENICTHFQGAWLDFYSRYAEGLKKAGKEWMTKCPFHDDQNPSLSVSEDGVWHCLAENIGGDAFAFYAKLNGLCTKASFPQILRGIGEDFGLNGSQTSDRREEELKREIVTAYDYTDEQGNLLYQKVRLEPKSFRLRRRNGKGGWISQIKGVRGVLYNLPKVVDADEVFVVEGEKDVDSLEQLGLVGTTNDSGAGKWDDTYTEVLAGKHVVIIPDNDEPGRQHAEQVAASLCGLAKDVRVVHLPGLCLKYQWFCHIYLSGFP